MRRSRVVLLTLLAACLLAESRTAPEAPSPVLAAQPQTSLDAAAVARIVGNMNPSLSAPELDRIGRAVVRYSGKYLLDPELVTAVLLVESGGRPWARSPKGAVGLMQVMPHMIGPLQMAGNAATIESNIEAGCFILAGNIRRLGEDDGVSAYFWGSRIRNVSYLLRVQAARAEVRRLHRS